MTYVLSDAWRVTLGARETWETRKMTEVASDLDPTKQNTNSIAPLLETFSADNKKNYSAFTPAGTISFFPQTGVFADTETMFYASISEGFKSGGFDGQASSLVSANTPFLPEESINYEFGFKSQFFDDRVQFNGAAFWTSFENMQLYQRVLTVPGDQATGTNIIVNVAEARIRGFEVETIVLFSQNFTLTANLGYQDPELTDATIKTSLPGVDPDGLRPLDGSRLPRAPKTNYFISGAYDIPVGNEGVLTLLASDRYTGDVHFDLGEPRPGGFQEGYHLVDASITYVPNASGEWRFMLWGKNLTDEEYWVEQQSVNAGATAIGRIGEPLTFGITAEWNWN
jgi:iron complex outermembrane receptor protein